MADKAEYAGRWTEVRTASPQSGHKSSNLLQDTPSFCQEGNEGNNDIKVEPGVLRPCCYPEPSRSQFPISGLQHIWLAGFVPVGVSDSPFPGWK